MPRMFIRCPECDSRDVWQKFTCSLPVNDQINGEEIEWAAEHWQDWAEGEYHNECTCGSCNHKWISELVARDTTKK